MTRTKLFRQRLTLLPLAIAAVGAGAVVSFSGVPAMAAEMTDQEILETALSAAPPRMREVATVVAPDGRVLREGTGGFTCMITPEVPTGLAPMCADETWMPWADAWVNGKPYDGPQRLGLAYMLAGDTPEGGASNIDPQARQPTADNDWVVEGPHIMLIVPDEAMVAHLPTDPDSGGPYVMWRGTPFAHVMVPLAPRPEQRQVAGAGD